MPTEPYIPPAFVGLMPPPLEKPLRDYKSPIEQLLSQLEAHEREEAEVLKDYQSVAKNAADRGFRYLMGLVIEDEERHHRISKAMADEVQQSLEWLHREEPMPGIEATGPERDGLLRQTERFLRIEEDGDRQLADLHTRVKGIDTGLLELMVDMMRADTHKHIQVLKYIKKRLEQR